MTIPYLKKNQVEKLCLGNYWHTKANTRKHQSKYYNYKLSIKRNNNTSPLDRFYHPNQRIPNLF